MRQSNQIDLRSRAGTRTQTINPGTAVQFLIDAGKSRIGGGGGSSMLYNYVRGLVARVSFNFTRVNGAGMTAVFADRFPQILANLNLNTPMDGTLIDPVIMDGMLLTQFNNFVQNGYMKEGLEDSPISTASATYNRVFYLYIPFAQKWNPWPDHFARWLGWLNNGTFEVQLAAAANPFGAQGGGTDTLNSAAISVTLDMVPWPEIIIPPQVIMRKYEVTAQGASNGPTLLNVGTQGSLQGVEDGSRLLAMIFSHNTDGFSGSGTADQIASITLPWRDQAQTYFADLFYARWLQASHRRSQMGFISTNAAIGFTDANDTAIPWPKDREFAGVTNDTLATNRSRYTPLVWPEVGGLVSYLQKVKGNYPLDMSFNATQTNVFRIYTLELKQTALDKCSEWISAMGIDPTTVQLVPKLGRKNFKKIDNDKLWGLPRSVVARR